MRDEELDQYPWEIAKRFRFQSGDDSVGIAAPKLVDRGGSLACGLLTAGQRTDIGVLWRVRAGRVSNGRWVLGCREGWIAPRGARETGFWITEESETPLKDRAPERIAFRYLIGPERPMVEQDPVGRTPERDG